MGWFAANRAARSTRRSARRGEAGHPALPDHFVAVGEALAEGGHVIEACGVAGRRLAEEGAPLGQCLDGLRSATRLIARRDPLFEESHAVALAWSESTLAYLHGLSCNDPLTGLSTLAHIRERISELYRAERDHDGAARSHALVVTQATLTLGDAVSSARILTLLGRTVRTVFGGTEAVGRLAPDRLVVVAPRDERLADRVSLLKRMAEPTAVRVWIEGLPRTDDHAAALLDELARGA